METLTQSKYRGFRGCPRYFYLRFEQKMVPRIDRDGRRRGTIFGRCLFEVQQAEESLKLDSYQEDGATYRQAIAIVIEEQIDAFYSDIHPTNQEMADELEIEKVKVEVMAKQYIARYGIDQRREVVYDLPLVNPLTGRTSRRFRRAGKIDGLVTLGKKHARVIEDKFTGSIQKVMIDRLPLDEQVTEYADALAQLEWTAEIEYRHTRYPGINPEGPKEFKTKPNRPAESTDDFRDRLTIDVGDRPEFYFDVQVLIFPQDMLAEHRHERWRTAKDIMRARTDLAAGLPLGQSYPRHRHYCERYGGCEFIPLCSGRIDAEALYVTESTDSPELGLTPAEQPA